MKVTCETVSLPPLSPSSATLMGKLSDEQAALGELADLVQMDPVLTSKLLKVANSPYFGMTGRIAYLEEAIMVIGTSVSRNYVLSDLVIGYFNQEPWKGLDLKEFWNRSLYSAAVCQLLAGRCSVPDSLGFTLGLFQRIGSLSLLGLLGKVYTKTFQANLPCLELSQTEKEAFGTDHGRVGGSLLTQWRLPLEITEPIAKQYEPETDQPDEATELLKCSHLFVDAHVAGQHVAASALSDRHKQMFKLDQTSIDMTLRVALSRFKTFKAIIDGAVND